MGDIQRKKRIVFFGLGSIGSRHLKLLPTLDNWDFELFAFRSGKSDKPTPSGVSLIRDWKELRTFGGDVAFICNPTSLHINTANRCAQMGLHLFIEKPLSHSLEGLANLKAMVQRKKLTAYVAYPLRFHLGVLKLREIIQNSKSPMHVRCVVSSYLPYWRPDTDHRESYSSIKKLGGGVILDLSHEIDLIHFLFGKVSNFSGTSDRLFKITRDAEDNADFVLLAGRAIVNLHMNFSSLNSERYIVVDFHDGFAKLDLQNGELIHKTLTAENVHKFKTERDDLFLNQLRYFFANLGSRKFMNSLDEAGPIFKKVMEMKRESL